MTFKTIRTNFHFVVTSTTIRRDAKKKTRKFVKERNKKSKGEKEEAINKQNFREKGRRNSNERV
jgi:hypothetical protein